MSIDFKRTKINGTQPAIWRGEVKMLPGGFAPGNTIPTGTVLKRGIPVYVDFEQMQAFVCKTAKVVAGGTTTAVRIGKGHCFAIGDTVMKVGVTNVSPTISAIDATNADYDVLSLSAAIADIAADDIIAEATAYTAAGEGVAAVDAAPKYTPNAIVGADKEFNGKGLPTIDAGYEAVVLYAHLAVPYLPEWVENGMCLKANHSIKLIKQ